MKRWRLVTLVAGPLALAAPVAHALERPVRLTHDAPLYGTATHTPYSFFAALSGPVEVGALACALTLSLLAWRDPSGSRAVRAWAIGGTACFLAAHAAFWILIQPASEVLGGWTPDAVSSNWTRFRDQWEWIHTIRAGLMLIGFCALLRSVFLDLPSRRARRDLPGKDYSFLELACSTAPESRDA